MTIRQKGYGRLRASRDTLLESMRFRTWPVAALGLLGLLVLIGVSLMTTYDRAVSLSTENDQTNRQHRQIFTKLRVVRNDVMQSAIYVRDYLLDGERARDGEYRARLAAFQRTSDESLQELTALMETIEGSRETLERLDRALDDYWQTYEPLFSWTTTDRLRLAADFVRTDVVNRREEVLALARDIESLNDTAYDAQRAGMMTRRKEFQGGLLALLWQCIVIGFVCAGIAVYRLRQLERRQDGQREVAEAAERRMRGLSQQIVAAQEEERRKLSRELHDHVGQLLTGLRMSLGSVERATAAGRTPLLGDARRIVDDITRIVRDLASGLRPSMLDDFGLQPALEWLARDVSRRCELPVSVAVDGGLEPLPDAHRTCIYRAVQEALTNAIKHSNASRVDVRVRRSPFSLMVTVADDGCGFRPETRTNGIGLRGLEERVKELSGSIRLETAPGRGTTLVVQLPLPEEVSAARLAG